MKLHILFIKINIKVIKDKKLLLCFLVVFFLEKIVTGITWCFSDRNQIKILVLSFSVWIFLKLYYNIFSFFGERQRERKRQTVRQKERQRKRERKGARERETER